MLEKEKSIIIISTTISICIMLLTGIDKSPDKKVINKQDSVINQSQIIIDKPKTETATTTTTSGISVQLDKDKVSNTSENKKESVVVKETKKPIEEKKSIETSKTPDNNESVALQLPKDDLTKNEDTEKTAPVFKVNREDIFGELSFFDKEKLLLISAKLKVSDYKKINELLQGDVDGKGVLSSLRILKDRLSENDYSKIKQIFSKFINMDLVGT